MPHAIRGTGGADLVEQLKPLGDKDYTVGKRRFSAFFGTDMDLYLREEGIKRVAVVGRPSNVCALYSAADAFQRRFETIAISDCLYSKTGEMHARALREFAETLGPVMTGDEFLAWTRKQRETAEIAEKLQLGVLVVNVNKDLVEHDLPEEGGRLAARLDKMQDLLSLAREKGLPVIYAMDAHLPDDWEFRVRKPHGIEGTQGAQVADEIAPLPGDAVFAKRGYDAFYETGLDPWLREKGITRLVIIGGPTNVDLRHTVVSAYNLRYAPIVIKDCVDASTEEYAVETLQDMFFCWRMTLDSFKEWLSDK
jgi:nicotinamidase-related amidase